MGGQKQIAIVQLHIKIIFLLQNNIMIYFKVHGSLIGGINRKKDELDLNQIKQVSKFSNILK